MQQYYQNILTHLFSMGDCKLTFITNIIHIYSRKIYMQNIQRKILPIIQLYYDGGHICVCVCVCCMWRYISVSPYLSPYINIFKYM